MSRRRPAVPRAAAVAALVALAPAAAPALADERDDRIRTLEEQVKQQAEEQAQLRKELDEMRRDAAGDLDHGALRDAVEEMLRDQGTGERGSYVGPSGVRRPIAQLDLGGYFSTRWANSELPGSNPAFQDMRFVVQMHAQVARAVTFDGEIEIEHGGISDETDGEVKVEYAQVAFSDSEAFRLKAGSLLVPWGRFNSEHDDPLNELSSRPTVSRYVHGVVHAGPGVGAEGSVEASDDLALHYDLVLNNGLSDDLSSGDGIRDARTLWEEDDNHDKTLFGRFGATPGVEFVDALDVGGSFAWGRMGEGGDDRLHGYGFDAAAKWGPWELKGEWAKLAVDREDADPPLSPAGLGPVRGMGGWYGQLVHRFTGGWVRGMPFADESASVALVLRRDAVDLNDRVRGAEPIDDERAWSLGVNYRPTTKTVIKLEYRDAESSYPGDEGSDRDLVVLEFATYF